MIKEKYKVLFEPIKIGSLEIKNRFVLAPMGPGGLCNADGSFNEKGEEFILEGEELLARAFCHEIDHLDGILYVDKVIK